MHSADCYVMSVCPSLAHWYCVVTVRHTVKIISVFFKTNWGFKIQTGSLPNGGVKCRWYKFSDFRPQLVVSREALQDIDVGESQIVCN